jgi:hypothetical protein
MKERFEDFNRMKFPASCSTNLFQDRNVSHGSELISSVSKKNASEIGNEITNSQTYCQLKARHTVKTAHTELHVTRIRAKFCRTSPDNKSGFAGLIHIDRKKWFLGSEKLRSMVLLILSICCISFHLAQQPPGGQGLLIHGVSSSHKTTHHNQ